MARRMRAYRSLGVIALVAGGLAITTSASAGTVSADDSRATVHQNNINACPPGEPQLVAAQSSSAGNGVTVTVTTLAAAKPNPYPANGVTTLPAGTQLVTVTLPAGAVLDGDIDVKGGNGYNDYPGSARFELIPPLNTGGNIAGLSHYLVCGTVVRTGSITVDKVVSGSGTGSDGLFTMDVDCGAAGDHSVSLEAGGSHTVDGIPAGSSCTVTETDNGQANSTSYAVDGGDPSASAPTVNVSAGSADTVRVTNTYDPATLVVTKHVVGDAPEGVTSYAFSVTCGDGSPVTFALADNGSRTFDQGLVGGETCSVEETDSGGATTTYTVGSHTTSTAPTVTLTNGGTTTVDVTNTFSPPPATSSVTLEKVLSGSPSADVPTTFTLDLTCGELVDEEHVTVGTPVTVSDLPPGTDCTVTEPDSAGAASTSYSVDGGAAGATAAFTLVAGHTTDVTVDNHYVASAASTSLTVTKVVHGSGEGASGPFTVTVDCGSAGVTVFSDLVDGKSDSTSVPVGSSCSVTETDPNGAASETYTVGEGTPSSNPPTVTAVAGGGTTVTVTNTFVPAPTGALTLHKSVDHSTIHYGQELTYTLVVGATGTLTQHDVVVTDELPTGTTFVSAGCPSPCVATIDDSGLVTWTVGNLSPGETKDLTLTVDVPAPAPVDGVTPVETITNSGTASSTETPSTPSNTVKTLAQAVLGEKVSRTPTPGTPPPSLAFTGDSSAVTLAAGLLLVLAGAHLLVTGGRRPRPAAIAAAAAAPLSAIDRLRRPHR